MDAGAAVTLALDVDEGVGFAFPSAADLAGAVLMVDERERGPLGAGSEGLVYEAEEGEDLVGGAAAFHPEATERPSDQKVDLMLIEGSGQLVAEPAVLEAELSPGTVHDEDAAVDRVALPGVELGGELDPHHRPWPLVLDPRDP